MKLYEINQALLNCVTEANGTVVDTSTGEVIDRAKLDALVMERDAKLENIALWIKDLKAEADAIKAEKDALAQRQKSAENKAEQLKQYLAFSLGEGNKFKTPRVALGWRRSATVEVADVMALPAEYQRIKPPEADKTKIKDALKAGTVVPGCTLIEHQSLSIR